MRLPMEGGSRAAVTAAARARPANLIAPVGGWNTKDSQARMGQQYAIYMETFSPRRRTVDLRKGCTSHATAAPATLKHLMSWQGPTTRKLFACTDAGIYDVTTAGP